MLTKSSNQEFWLVYCCLTSASCPIGHVVDPEQQLCPVNQWWSVPSDVTLIAANLHQGPVAQNVRDQAAKTSSEFQNLANSRTIPSQPAATGQPLTHYHSMFYNLLSVCSLDEECRALSDSTQWQNPRASAFSFATVLFTILSIRYLHILHYIFKTGFYVLSS